MSRFAPGRFWGNSRDALSNRISLRLRDGIRAAEANDLRPTQTGKRLTQRAAGENVFEAEGFKGVEEYNIQIAAKAPVLKSII
jgi:hypothetical protein